MDVLKIHNVPPLPVDDLDFRIVAAGMRFAGCEVVWTWPRWLRWCERAWRTVRGRWLVSYRFEALPDCHSVLLEE